MAEFTTTLISAGPPVDHEHTPERSESSAEGLDNLPTIYKDLHERAARGDDCVSLATRFFLGIHGRYANRPMDLEMAAPVTADDLRRMWDGEWAGAAAVDTGELLNGLRVGESLLVYRPALGHGTQAHVLWLVADAHNESPRLRWIDPQDPDPTLIDRIVDVTDATDSRIAALRLPDTRVMRFDRQGYPVALNAHIGDTSRAVIDPQPGGLRPGAIGAEAELRPLLVIPRDIRLRSGEMIASHRHLGLDVVRDKTTVHGRGESILEVVTRPLQAVPGEENMLTVAEAAANIRKLARLMAQAQDQPRTTLGEVFDRHGPGWAFADASYRNFGIRPDPRPDRDPRTVYAHYTVGVPMSTLRSFLGALRADIYDADRQATLDAALEYGDRAAGQFLNMPDLDLNLVAAAPDEHTRALAGFLAVAYLQVAARAIYVGEDDGRLAKNRTPIIARESLQVMRAELPAQVKEFLQQQAPQLGDLFRGVFNLHRPGMHDDVLEVDHGTGERLGDFLDNALLDDPPVRYTQRDVLGVTTEWDELDVPQEGGFPLARLEVRHLEPHYPDLDTFEKNLTRMRDLAQWMYAEAGLLHGRTTSPTEIQNLAQWPAFQTAMTIKREADRLGRSHLDSRPLVRAALSARDLPMRAGTMIGTTTPGIGTTTPDPELDKSLSDVHSSLETALNEATSDQLATDIGRLMDTALQLRVTTWLYRHRVMDPYGQPLVATQRDIARYRDQTGGDVAVITQALMTETQTHAQLIQLTHAVNSQLRELGVRNPHTGRRVVVDMETVARHRDQAGADANTIVQALAWLNTHP